MIFTKLLTASFAATSTSSSGLALSPDIFIALPNIIENTCNAIMLSFDNILEKFFHNTTSLRFKATKNIIIFLGFKNIIYELILH